MLVAIQSHSVCSANSPVTKLHKSTSISWTLRSQKKVLPYVTWPSISFRPPHHRISQDMLRGQNRRARRIFRVIVLLLWIRIRYLSIPPWSSEYASERKLEHGLSLSFHSRNRQPARAVDGLAKNRCFFFYNWACIVRCVGVRRSGTRQSDVPPRTEPMACLTHRLQTRISYRPTVLRAPTHDLLLELVKSRTFVIQVLIRITSSCFSASQDDTRQTDDRWYSQSFCICGEFYDPHLPWTAHQQLAPRTIIKSTKSQHTLHDQAFKMDNCVCSAREEWTRRPSEGFIHYLKSLPEGIVWEKKDVVEYTDNYLSLHSESKVTSRSRQRLSIVE